MRTSMSFVPYHMSQTSVAPVTSTVVRPIVFHVLEGTPPLDLNISLNSDPSSSRLCFTLELMGEERRN
jgi:hypothetical protein